MSSTLDAFMIFGLIMGSILLGSAIGSCFEPVKKEEKKRR